MKQKILTALKAKYEGVSEKILVRMADKLAKTTTKEEDVQTAVDGVTFQQVLDSYGDARATEAQQTAVKNYETKYGLKEGEKVEDPAHVDTTTTQTDGGANAELLKAINDIKTELAAMKGEKQTASRKAELQKRTASLPETLRKAYDRTPVDGMTDDEFKTLLTEVETEVQEIGKETQQRGVLFGRPFNANSGQQKNNGTTTGNRGGNGGTDVTAPTDDEVAAVVAKLGL